MRHFTAIILGIISLSSCKDLIQYSPYDADVSEYGLNEKNIREITEINPADTLWFIALSDVHHWYDNLKEATGKINTLSNISFVVVCGDITDVGLCKEFEWYNEVMKNLKVPYITLVGNHDYRSNGDIIYKKMFGPSNFTFDVAPYHFIGFDDVVWEHDNTFPNFEWLNTSLCDTTSTIQVVFAHLPPWSSDLNLDKENLNQIISKKPKHTLIIHGHEHGYYYELLHAHNFVLGSVEQEEMYLVGLCGSSFNVKCIKF